MKRTLEEIVVLGFVSVAFVCPAVAGDWPQFRYDAARSAASPETLPTSLHLQWVRELPTHGFSVLGL